MAPAATSTLDPTMPVDPYAGGAPITLPAPAPITYDPYVVDGSGGYAAPSGSEGAIADQTPMVPVVPEATPTGQVSLPTDTNPYNPYGASDFSMPTDVGGVAPPSDSGYIGGNIPGPPAPPNLGVETTTQAAEQTTGTPGDVTPGSPATPAATSTESTTSANWQATADAYKSKLAALGYDDSTIRSMLAGYKAKFDAYEQQQQTLKADTASESARAKAETSALQGRMKSYEDQYAAQLASAGVDKDQAKTMMDQYRAQLADYATKYEAWAAQHAQKAQETPEQYLARARANAQSYAAQQAQQQTAQAGQNAASQARAMGMTPAQAALLASQQAGGLFGQAYQGAMGQGMAQYQQAEQARTEQNRFAAQAALQALQGGQGAVQAGAGVGAQQIAQQQQAQQLLAQLRGAGLGALGQQGSLAQQQGAANLANLAQQQQAIQAGAGMAQAGAGMATQMGQEQMKGQQFAMQNLLAQAGLDQQAMQNLLQQQGLDVQRYGIDKGVQTGQAQAGAGALGGILSAIGPLLGLLVSDEDAKIVSKDPVDALGSVIKNIGGHAYRYKQGRGQDPTKDHYGPMAQEIEKTPLKDAVVNTPNGKMVNTSRLALGNTSLIAELGKKVDDLYAYIERNRK